MQKQKPKWLALEGIAVLEDGAVRQDAPKPATKKTSSGKTKDKVIVDEDDRPWLILRSDVMFEDGEITCEMLVEYANNKVQFRLGNSDTSLTYVGINVLENAYGIAQRATTTKGREIVAKSLASPDTPPPTGKWFQVRIVLQGSLIELYIDGIRVAKSQIQIVRAPLELVIRGHGTTHVRHITVSAAKPQVFVVMQFTDEYNQLYREVICPVCAEFGYEVIRGDNIYTSTLIIDDIAASIRESSLVIADITPNNANVYYEVGFAHGISKPTILLSDRKREKLPFDISGFRLIFYDNSIAGKAEVEGALRKHLSALRS
jgi:hypothetical protein